MTTEAQLQSAVIDAAHTFGWLVHHVKPARTPDGQFLTRIAGDAGFPDLVLARGGEVLFVELKSAVGKLRAAQEVWRDALMPPETDATHDYLVWRPSDWSDGTIIGALR